MTHDKGTITYKKICKDYEITLAGGKTVRVWKYWLMDSDFNDYEVDGGIYDEEALTDTERDEVEEYIAEEITE